MVVFLLTFLVLHLFISKADPLDEQKVKQNRLTKNRPKMVDF